MEEKQTAGQPQHGCFFCNVAGPQIEAMIDHIWPETTREHFRNARIEMLKGYRSILDAKIERMSKRSQKGAKVTVE